MATPQAGKGSAPAPSAAALCPSNLQTDLILQSLVVRRTDEAMKITETGTSCVGQPLSEDTGTIGTRYHDDANYAANHAPGKEKDHRRR